MKTITGLVQNKLCLKILQRDTISDKLFALGIAYYRNIIRYQKYTR